MFVTMWTTEKKIPFIPLFALMFYDNYKIDFISHGEDWFSAFSRPSVFVRKNQFSFHGKSVHLDSPRPMRLKTSKQNEKNWHRPQVGRLSGNLVSCLTCPTWSVPRVKTSICPFASQTACLWQSYGQVVVTYSSACMSLHIAALCQSKPFII